MNKRDFGFAMLLMGILFGNGLSILYSISGGILSLLIMSILKKIKGFSITGISIGGAVSHNMGQLLMAVVILGNIKISYYIPILLIAGIITGIFIGQLSTQIIKVIKKVNRES